MQVIEGFESGLFHHRVFVYDAATHALKGDSYCELGNMFIPEGWSFGFAHGKPVVEDPTNKDGWGQPEAHYSTGFPNRLHRGIRSYMWFGFYRATDSWLWRHYDVAKGDDLQAEVLAHGWSANGNDPLSSDGVGRAPFVAEVGTPGLSDAVRNISFQMGIDPTGGIDIWSPSVVWGTPLHIYNIFAPVQAQALALGNKATAFIRGRNIWRLQHNDFYIDDMSFSADAPSRIVLGPRLDYARTVLLVPQSATKEQWLMACAVADANHWTVSRSHDDAAYAPGLTIRRVILAWFTSTTWDRPKQVAFFNEFYPGTSLDDINFYSTTPPIVPEPPVTPEPPEPPAPQPRRPSHRSRASRPCSRPSYCQIASGCIRNSPRSSGTPI